MPVDAETTLLLPLLVLLTLSAAVSSPQSCFNDPIAAWYDGSSVDLPSLQWTDKSGNGFHASFTNTVPLLFDDADATSDELYLNGEPVLYGDTSTIVMFPDDLIVGKEHTIFNACKYQEGGSEQRILQSRTINALFGFWRNSAGVAYESGWMTSSSTETFGTEWVLSSQSSPFYRANGIDYTIASGKANAIGTLAINAGKHGTEDSDWACAEILIINAELSEEEVECVENTYFNCKYGEGFGDGVCEAPPHDCADFNIDGVLNECSADFPAEKEALEAATARVTQLESDTATTDAAVEALSADLVTLQSEAAMSADLAATDATVEALSADLSTLESEAATTSASLAATDATVESLGADLSTLESSAATTTANLAATDVAVGDLSSRLDSTEESVQNDFAALENRLAEIETWKAAWQSFESARAGPGIDIGAENELEQAANVSVFELSASSPLMIGAMALLAVLLAANLCFVTRSCSARAKGKYAAVAAVDSADSEEMSPIRV